MKHLSTTLIGAFEAAFMAIGAEVFLTLTWKQRGMMFGWAFLRALFGYMAADARASEVKNVG